MTIPSYGKIWNLGHRQLEVLFDGEVLIQEKVDGSYFAFSKSLDGRLECRSKGTVINLDDPDKLFAKAVEVVKNLEPTLTPGYVYCCEYLSRPKHNTLAYDRVPRNHLVLFDIEREPKSEKWLTTAEVLAEADRLELEICPQFTGFTSQSLTEALKATSCLGGQKIEGVVIKNYNKFGIDGKILRGKLVSPAFKEVHNADWKERNPGPTDFKTALGQQYKTRARWNKAIQHLREAGTLVNGPQDIGPLMKEINLDVLTECSDEIKEKLFKWAWPSIARELTKGFPEYYRAILADPGTEQ